MCAGVQLELFEGSGYGSKVEQNRAWGGGAETLMPTMERDIH